MEAGPEGKTRQRNSSPRSSSTVPTSKSHFGRFHKLYVMYYPGLVGYAWLICFVFLRYEAMDWDPVDTLVGDGRNCTFYKALPDALLQATMTGDENFDQSRSTVPLLHLHILTIALTFSLSSFTTGNLSLVECVLGNLTDGTVDFIDNGIQINIVNEVAETPLIYASRTGMVEIASLLIQNGANLDIRSAGTGNGGTALHLAVSSYHPSIVNLLVNSGANLTIQNNFGKTAIDVAVEKKYEDLVLAFARAGASTTCDDEPTEDTFIHLARAGRAQDLLALSCLVDKTLDYLDYVDENGNTAVMNAVISGSLEIASLLIAKNANLDKKNNGGDTALMLTSKYYPATADIRGDQSLDYIALELIRHDANLDIQNSVDGKTALMTAVLVGQTNIAISLIENGANLDLREFRTGLTALHMAAAGGYMSIVRALVQGGCSLDLRSFLGNSAVMMAALEGQDNVAKYLLDECADTSIKNREGKMLVNLARFQVPEYIFLNPKYSRGCSYDSQLAKCVCL